jgi:polyisoprenyl-phosphate glycosyltransferase
LRTLQAADLDFNLTHYRNLATVDILWPPLIGDGGLIQGSFLLPTISRVADRDGEPVVSVSDLNQIRASLSDDAHRTPMPSKLPLLSVVIPLFNEELNVGQLHRRLRDSLDPLGEPYEIVFVNDGSRDDTPRRLERIQDESPQVSVIHLSRNFGHQAAVSAGLEYARGRAVVVMDGDLQDPPEVLPQFVERWRTGYDVVYAIRLQRKEGPVMRLCYFLFYRIMNAISDIDIPLDSGDFCLMDRKVVEVLVGLPERMRFVRGLRTFVGFKQTGLEYERAAREAGNPKYTLRLLISLAIDGLVSFSSYPLRLLTYLGLVTASAAGVITVWVLIDAVVNHTAPRGWASVMAAILFVGSIQLIGQGVVGEYVRLIFLESKRRPMYIIGEYRPMRSTLDEGHAVAQTIETGQEVQT